MIFPETADGNTEVSKQPIQKLNQHHHRVIDLLLAHPTPSGNQICEIMGMTAPWLSTVRGSDVFKQEFARRRMAFADHRDIVVQTQLSRIVGTGLTGLADHLDAVDEEGDPVASFHEFKVATELALKASGYLGAGTQVNIQNNTEHKVVNNSVDASTLMAARARLLQGGRDVETIEGETLPAT